MKTQFFPMTRDDLEKRSWDYLDFIAVTGDAYVDHPSFGIAIICRVLESKGYRVGIIAQPDWRNINDFVKLGKPKYAFLVTGGNIDSMVNHYTVAKKKRSKDSYSPGGVIGKRPDRASIVYSQMIRQAFKDAPIILGGIEASLRRFAHYDYWDNKIRRSVLIDSGADIIAYGMGEKAIIEIAENLEAGIPIDEITYVKGTVFKTKDLERFYDFMLLPAYNEITVSRAMYAKSFMLQFKNTDHITAETLVEKYPNCYVVQNPPQPPLTTSEMDGIYSIGYMGAYHSMYDEEGGVPALEEVRFSITSSRGCFGSCNFCALTFHQGRTIQSRSHAAIIQEAKALTWNPDFKGYIHDVGGPTANFRYPSCKKQKEKGMCINKQCLFPDFCKNLIVDHSDYSRLLLKLQEIPKVKKVFIRSGIRYDYLLKDSNESFFYQLCKNHISGQLKIAPEHISQKVLEKMGKPSKEIYLKFAKKYKEINKKIDKEQYLVPYFMSSHPGSTLTAAIELAEFLQTEGISPEQVQDFYPTPGTLSTCMYYTGLDPRTNEKVYVPRSPHEKAIQRALIQYKLPQNYELVYEALVKTKRTDLIGYGKKCLIKPRRGNAKREK